MTAKSPFSVRRSEGKKVMDQGRVTKAKVKTQRTAEVTRLREGRKDYTCNSALLCAPQGTCAQGGKSHTYPQRTSYREGSISVLPLLHLLL